jgi:hypothetical protein
MNEKEEDVVHAGIRQRSTLPGVVLDVIRSRVLFHYVIEKPDVVSDLWADAMRHICPLG